MARPGISDHRYIAITADLYGIVDRLQAIDPGYFICLRRDTGAYELHHTHTPRSYQLTLPFDALDARAVEWVRRTRIERMPQLIAQLDRENDQLQRRQTHTHG